MSIAPILVLGGGRHQINLIHHIIASGYPVVLSDYLRDSPGHKIATTSTLTDARDTEANLLLAKAHGVQGIITTGTDQPLVVMAEVAAALGIPGFLTPESARRCTNKIKMFEVLSQEGAKVPDYVLLTSEDDIEVKTADLRFPLVVKPCDSQGQRGITIARDPAQLAESFVVAIGESANDTVIAQEFIEGPEMTISGWVSAGRAQIMLITDRVTYNRPPATGVCLQHIYPSTNIDSLESAAQELLEQVSKAYLLSEGPVYIQCVRSDNQLFIIEATCRIGGGHEEHLIEHVTGINIHEHLLSLATHGSAPEFPELSEFPVPGRNSLINFMVARPGTINKIQEPEPTPESPYGGFYYGEGYRQTPIINSMGRVGYFVSQHKKRKAMIDNAADRYQQYAAFDLEGTNLLFWPESRYLNQ